MSSVYTGVPGNVAASASPTTTIPSDGDMRNVASVNAALQKLTDYVAQLETQAASILFFGAGTMSNAPGTFYLVPGYIVQAPVNAALILCPQAGKISKLYVRETGSSTGGSVTYTVGQNGVDSAITCTIAAGGFAGTDLTHSFTVAAGDYLYLKAVNNAGVSAGITNAAAALLYTLV